MRRALAIILDAVLFVAFIAAVGERVSFARDRDRFPAPGVLVDVAPGRRLHLQCSGHGAPTVIFEAGGTHDSMQYAPIRARVAECTRACAYDRAGMGFSDPSGAGDARALADDLEALLRRAGLDGPFVFVAGSAGGLTIELFAREHPQDVAGLVWLDGVTGEIADEMADAEGPLVRRAALAMALANVGAIGWFDPHGFGSGPDEARNRARAYHHAAWDTTYAIVRARETSVAALRAAPPLRGDVPLVVLVHERAEGVHAEPGVSARWRAAEERFARRSSRGRFIVSTGSGHHPEDDRPDLVAALVRAMVEDHRGR